MIAQFDGYIPTYLQLIFFAPEINESADIFAVE